MKRLLLGLLAAALLSASGACSSAKQQTTTAGTGGATGTGGGDSASSATSSAGGATSSATTGSATGGAGSGGGPASGRGFPDGGPWASFYGPADGLDLAKLASSFRIINLDADPDGANFTAAQILELRAGGQNRVISYLNVGSCEDFRSYWSVDPPGHKSCQSTGALTSLYDGYPDERWADLSNADYHDLIVNYVAPRLAAMGVDGFFLDNMEVVEHAAGDSNGPCDAACSQGGLDLVWELRQKFPDLLIVMQNATSDVTRKGKTHGAAYPSLLDGVSHEEVYSNGGDPQSQAEMQAWRGMSLMVNGRPFWLAAEDYVGACSAAKKPAADAIYAEALGDGINEYVTDDSGMQLAPCFWSDF
jgi:cysteinyl-tRNA synthetase